MANINEGEPIETVDALEIHTAEDLAKLCDWSYEQKIDHFVYRGLTYYQYSNKWFERPKSIAEMNRDWDPDRPCYGYMKHRARNSDKPELSDDEDSDNEHAWNCANHESAIDLSKKAHDHKEVQYVFAIPFNAEKDGKEERKLLYEGHGFIRLSADLVIVNPHVTYITDHRGSNHCKLDFSRLFVEQIVLTAGVYSVSDIAESFWRLKSNKFDNHYEWVLPFDGNASVGGDGLNGGSILKVGESWRIKLLVDYGS